MEKTIDKIINVSIELQELFAFISGFIQNPELNDKIKKSIAVGKPTNFKSAKEALDNLYNALELIAFVISEKEGSSEQIANSIYMRTVKLGNYFRQLDSMSNSLYRMAKKNPELSTDTEQKIRKTTNITEVYGELNISPDVFGYLNPEFLLPTEEYIKKDELPKDASIIHINVKNTQNLVMGIRTLIDVEYIKSAYKNLTPTSGVSDEMVNRFSVLKLYPTPTEETTILPLGTQEVYQQLGDVYRKFIYYPSNDYVRNYDFLPMNALITNFENKRITMSRQNIPKNQIYTPIEEKSIGLIKNNFANKKMCMADAIFHALYKESMTDEQVTKLGFAAYALQDNMPRCEGSSLASRNNRKMVETDFQKFINRKTIRSVL